MAKQGDVPPPGLGKLNANKHETLSHNKVNLKQKVLCSSYMFNNITAGKLNTQQNNIVMVSRKQQYNN